MRIIPTTLLRGGGSGGASDAAATAVSARARFRRRGGRARASDVKVTLRWSSVTESTLARELVGAGTRNGGNATGKAYSDFFSLVFRGSACQHPRHRARSTTVVAEADRANCEAMAATDGGVQQLLSMVLSNDVRVVRDASRARRAGGGRETGAPADGRKGVAARRRVAGEERRQGGCGATAGSTSCPIWRSRPTPSRGRCSARRRWTS